MEFTRVGAWLRVSAMEPATLTEVVVQGPAHAGEAAFRAAALRKLRYVIGRETRCGRR